MHLCPVTLVSVLIPVKNASAWLDDCLNSVQNQQLTDWECLLLNDESEDNSGEIIAAKIQNDHRFKLVKATGHGLIQANCDLLKAAQGQFVTRMDADDLMPEYRLKEMADTLKNATPKTIVTAQVKFFPETACGPGTRFYENWLNERCAKNDHWQHIWRECVIPSPCWMMRTAELRDSGGFDLSVYPEDYDMALRLFFSGFKVLSVNKVCHLWRQHNSRFSKNSENYSAEKFMSLKWNYWKDKYAEKGKPVYILGTMDKGKILNTLVQADGFDVVWFAHKEHIAGNKIGQKVIQYYQDFPMNEGEHVISTLSSIDDHTLVYDFLEKAKLQVFKFC